MLSHLVSLVRSNQLRFRAETFGLYYPALPGRRHAWTVSPRGLLLLAQSLRTYPTWQARVSAIARGGAHEWWGRQWPGIDLEGELARLSRDDPGPD